MKCVHFLTDNYFDQELYANLYESSEKTNFPSTNVTAKIRRSKVWRTNGYYKVVDGENTIVFRETNAGADLTATVTAGEYTTHAAFMAAVKAALDAAGDSTYTVTQSSNFRFVIASNGSGGGGVFQPRFATSTDMAAILGFDDVNLSGSLTYTADYLRMNTEDWLTVDFGLPTNPNAFAMTGNRNQAIKLSPSGTFRLMGNQTDNWDSPSFTVDLNYDDEVICKIEEDGFHTEPLRYWRVQFLDQNPLGYIELGAVFLGNTYTTDRGAAQFPFQSEFDDQSKTVLSEGGQSFSDIIEKTQDFSLTWNALTKEEIEAISEIYERYGKSYPFFMAFDATEAFSTSIERRVRYVKFREDPSYQLDNPNNFSMRMRFREEL